MSWKAMEVSMSKTRRGKYIDNRICHKGKCKGDVRFNLRGKGKIHCFSYLCEGNHFRFIEERYKLNLRNPLLLEEYFLVMEQFDSTLSSVIGSTLGLRCRSFGYRYSEIIRSLMSNGMLWAEVVYSSLYLSDNSVMRGRVHAKRTLRGLVADLRI